MRVCAEIYYLLLLLLFHLVLFLFDDISNAQRLCLIETTQCGNVRFVIYFLFFVSFYRLLLSFSLRAQPPATDTTIAIPMNKFILNEKNDRMILMYVWKYDFRLANAQDRESVCVKERE